MDGPVSNGSRGGGSGGGGGGGGYGRSSGWGSVNAMGFHGDMREDAATEARLFGGGNPTGINFDKYDDIPVETSGEGVPEPLAEFNSEILGEALMRNIARSKYTKPTPVQKFSVPIGYAGRDMMACAQTGACKRASPRGCCE